ncbi:Sensor protein [Gammaproteobacteria bacterium]
MTEKVKIFEYLEKTMHDVPVPFYWLGINQEYLGVNKNALEVVGAKSYNKDFAGKTPYDIYPKEMAENIIQHHKKVLQTGETLSAEELIKDVDGEIKYFNATIAPLYDDNGKIIGTIGISVDITAEKKETERLKKASVLEHLDRVAQLFPTPIYWLGLNQEYLGVNELVLKGTGTQSYKKDFAGKTPCDLYPKKMAENIIQHHKEVITTKRSLAIEETFRDVTTGQVKSCNAYIAPLYDDYGKIIGTLGTSLDTTAEKEAARLKIENERQKEIIKISDQVSHDIRSPARTIYAMVENNAEKIPEEIRIPLRETAASIIDVASSLIGRYEKDKAASGLEEQKPIIVSLSLMQILSEKRVQNTGLLIDFTEDYSHDSMLAFIKVQPSHFKRMISNLFNNAIEALEGKKGTVHLSLSIDEIKKDVKIIIQDNGKGMSEETANKIKSGATVATDKKEGHGIGLTQIRETIELNRGKFDVVSKLGEGTKMILTFPMAIPPQWLAKDIKLNEGDTVIILDDDPAMHGIWDMYFKKYKNDIQLKHFIIGKEAINFINTFPEKNKIYLLADKELMKQDGLTGMDVIKQTNLERATLVTSHYADIEVQKFAAESGIGILPKDLATEASIEICKANEKCSPVAEAEKVNLVIADDSEMMCDTVVRVVKTKNKNADKYCNPDNFLKNVHKYDKDTIMLVDHEFKGSALSGFDVLKQLREHGFTRLYLFSGREFEKNEIPDYLTVIMKTDIDTLMKLIES